MKLFEADDRKAVTRQVVGWTIIALIGVVCTAFKVYQENTQKGVDAYDKIQIVEPKLDTLKRVVRKHIEADKEYKQSIDQRLNNAFYRDSVQSAERFKTMDYLIEKLQQKPK